MHTNCLTKIEDITADDFSLNLGSAKYFRGDFERPWFMEGLRTKMMDKASPRHLHFKSPIGEVYQFRLSEFHNKKAILLTSTLMDTFWFFVNNPSIDNTMAIARKNQAGYACPGSYSGVSKWGNYFEELLERLEQGMAFQGVELTDESMKIIAKELLRREKIYDSI